MSWSAEIKSATLCPRLRLASITFCDREKQRLEEIAFVRVRSADLGDGGLH